MSCSIDGNYATWSWEELLDQHSMYIDFPRERINHPGDFAELVNEMNKRRREGRTPAGGKL